MNTFLWVVIITAIAGIGGTGIGGLVGALFNHDSEKTVSFLLSFAAGVMLSVVCFDLLFDAIEQNPNVALYFPKLSKAMKKVIDEKYPNFREGLANYNK